MCFFRKRNFLTIIIDVHNSLVGCIIWGVVFVAWIIVYQCMWREVPFFQSLQMATTEGIAWQ